jgi:hypothetical protein
MAAPHTLPPDDYLELHHRVLDQLHHEDRLFADRIRNFLTAASFLVAGYLASEHNRDAGDHRNDSLGWLVVIVGIVLSWFYLEIGARCAHGIRFWRAVLQYVEERILLPPDEVSLPDTFLRPIYYKRFGKQLFWKALGDSNALQGIWVPALIAALWFWILRYGAYSLRLPVCGLNAAPLLFWTVVVACVVRVAKLARGLRGRCEPSEVEGWLNDAKSLRTPPVPLEG